MRLIDADALIKHLDDAIQDAKRKDEICDYWEDDRSNLLYYLDTASTIDAVSVVRCKECKYGDMELCHNIWSWFGDDGFCSFGKRRER